MPKSVHTSQTQQNEEFARRTVTSENLAGGFTQVPDAILRDTTLPCAARLIYEYLLLCCRQNDRCWPSVQRMAEHLGISRRTIIRMIKLLDERGYIKKVRRGLTRTNLYFITPLNPPEPPRPSGPRSTSSSDTHNLQDDPQDNLQESTGEAQASPANKFFCPNSRCQETIPKVTETPSQEVSDCSPKHIELNHTQEYTDTRDSSFRSGKAGLRGCMESHPTHSHQGLETIGTRDSLRAEIQKTSGDRYNKSGNQFTLSAQIKPGNQITSSARQERSSQKSNHSKPEEISRENRAKEVEEEKTGKRRTFEEVAALIGITPEAMQGMKNWLATHRRPETIPLKLQGIIPVWSRELGNSEPHLIAANLTQASKLYAYARTQGLSQPETESCFEHAREVVRKRPWVQKKMAFFFSSLRLDILAALKHASTLAATISSIPDGYEDPTPTDAISARFKTSIRPALTRQSGTATPTDATPAGTRALTQPTGTQKSEPPPPTTKQIVPLPDSPRPEWRSWQTAEWWGEQLCDELDPGRTFSRYEVRPIAGGRYGFVLLLNPPADPLWEELVAGDYVASATVRRSIKSVQAAYQMQDPKRNPGREGNRTSALKGRKAT
jgi:hypothetical protein